MDKQQILNLLRSDVVPALGCTEPVCVALCAACAAAALPGTADSLTVRVNPGIYKNGMSAGIPHCDAVGLHYAAAMGAWLKNPKMGLELLSDATEETTAFARQLVTQNAVDVAMEPGEKGLYVRCTLRCGGDEAVCLIRGAHTNIVLVSRNGEILFEKQPSALSGAAADPAEELKEMTIAELRQLVCLCSEEELAFMMDGVKMNEALAAYSLTTPTGVGIAKTLREKLGTPEFANDLLNRILIQVSSAAESRLDGCPLPTMSSSGAGTKGLVLILPVAETAMALGASREATVRALAFAHLVNRYINAHIGKLSPMCSCVMSSSTAACAAMTWLMGGTDQQIAWAIRNMSGTVTGMLCDGGKVGCALKVSTGSAAAFLCAVTAVKDAALRVSDGICAETAEDCIRNMARIGIRGMASTDAEILAIMAEKKL